MEGNMNLYYKIKEVIYKIVFALWINLKFLWKNINGLARVEDPERRAWWYLSVISYKLC